MTPGMDLNPHEFTAPFEDYEFGTHVVASNATLAVVPMAWLTEQSGGEPSRPDRMTQEYWASRMRPAMNRADGSETLLVTCNRVGVEDDVVFAGSSAVMGFVDGRVRVYACLGRGEEALLVCDVGGSV